jgi:DNA mismatch repair protein MutS
METNPIVRKGLSPWFIKEHGKFLMSLALKATSENTPQRDRDSLPPMLKQYLEYKDEYPDCLLLIQVGDFYEAFFQDAVHLAETLNVTLTSRDKNSENPIPMAGVPIAVVDGYVTRMVAEGFSVAIVSQQGSATGKGMVKRSLERIITPGIRVHGESVADGEAALVACLAFDKRPEAAWDSSFEIAIAYSDVATGKISLIQASSLAQCEADLKRISPCELVLPAEVEGQVLDRRLQWVRQLESSISGTLKFRRAEWLRALQEQRTFSSVQGYSSLAPVGKKAVRLLVAYADETTVEGKLAFEAVNLENASGQVSIDATTRKNLELVKNTKDGSSEGTLYAAINRTRTIGGAKLLRRWLSNPSSDLNVIESRLEASSTLITAVHEREELQERLRYMVDFDRIVSRLELGVINPLELGALRDALVRLPEVQELLQSLQSGQLLDSIVNQLNPQTELLTLLETALAEAPPALMKDGGIFAAGFDAELDKLRSLKESGSSWILKLEAEERERTGVTSLKIKHNNVHGYFIEVTKANAGKVPEVYTKKQTTSNAERFITAELKEIEEQIVGAQDRLLIRERELFDALKEQVKCFSSYLRSLGEAVAMLDVLLSFAEISESQGYIRPELNDSEDLRIEKGKHPVLMQLLEGRYVPNSLHFSVDKRCAILTGANMGGKSTYLRQAAMIVILAQIGCYVPAKKAVIGVVDRIFARLGASDDILEGESTFMVEMREASHIVSEATSRSLLLIDEIGRGTATADGLSIAQAILEWIVTEIKSRTLFATHFHELTALDKADSSIFNISIASVDDGEHVVFTHEIVPGPANKSYGLEVAKIAGLPASLITRARLLLDEFESDTLEKRADKQLSMFGAAPLPSQVSPEEEKKISDAKRVLETIEGLDVNAMTPVEALVALSKIKDACASKKK